MKKALIFIVLSALIIISGCSDDDNPTAPSASAPASLVGTWSGVGNDGSTEVAAIVTINSHSESNWSGTWKTNQSGTISRTINGNDIKYSGEINPPCKGVFSGSGNVSGAHIESNHTVTDCSGTFKVSFSLEKN